MQTTEKITDQLKQPLAPTRVKKVFYIYALIDPCTEETRYVGVTSNWKQRRAAHLRTSRPQRNVHRVCWIKGLKARGLEPRMEVIEETSEAEWAEREIYWIAEMRRRGHQLTNHSEGGSGPRGVVVTDEMREAQSKRSKAYFSDPENRARLSAITKSKGWTRSEEQRAAVSAAQKGRKRTPEQRAAMSERMKGTTPAAHTEKTKAETAQRFRKLSIEAVAEIRSALTEDPTFSNVKILAGKYSVSIDTIRNIREGYKYFGE